MSKEKLADQRRINLKTLMQGFETKKAFAEHAGISTAHLTMISSPLKRSNIGDKAARKFEIACDKPYGWLDNDQDKFNGLPFDVDLVIDAIDALDEALAEVNSGRLHMNNKVYKKMLKEIIIRSYNDNEITIIQAKDYLVSAHVKALTD